MRSATSAVILSVALVLMLAPPRVPASGDHSHGSEEHAADEEHDDQENRVELDADTLARLGLEIERAGPARLEDRLLLYGRIGPDEERVAHVVPRFPGVIRRLTKSVGDPVARDEVLAVVESNESLRPFEVRSPLAGVVVGRRAAVGEVTDDEPIYVVADLSSVWLDLAVPRHDLSRIAVGTPLVVHVGGAEISAEVDYLSPLAIEATQSVLARSVVANPDGRLHPGLFASAEAIVATAEVAVAVLPSAIQTLDSSTVVFRAVGEAFEARPVEIGRRDARFVEILDGLRPGDAYVAEGSFVLKSELSVSEGDDHHH